MTTKTDVKLAGYLQANIPLVILGMLLFDSLHFVYAKLLLAFLPPPTTAFYVMAIATVEWLLIMSWWRPVNFALLRQHFTFFAAVGGLIAAAMIFSYTSAAYVDPGTASLLARASTIFSIMFGLLWLKDKLTLPAAVGMVIALIGTFVISFQPGDYLRWGSLMVIGSSFTYALHVAVVKKYGDNIEFANFFLFRVAGTLPFLFLYSLTTQQFMLPPNLWTCVLLLITATSDVTLSRVLYYLVLRQMTVSIHAIILTLSPILTVLWSWLLFDQWPTLQTVVGGVGVTAGVLIATQFAKTR